MEGISEHDGPLQLPSSITVIAIVIIIIIIASVQELLLIEWVSQSTHPVVLVKLEMCPCMCITNKAATALSVASRKQNNDTYL